MKRQTDPYGKAMMKGDDEVNKRIKQKLYI